MIIYNHRDKVINIEQTSACSSGVPDKNRRFSTDFTTASTCSSFSQEELVKRNLAEKLERFRDESKTALQKSWDDVECLQKNCADFVGSNAKLRVQMREAEGRKEMWRARCNVAEEAIIEKVEQRSLQHLCGVASFRDSAHLNPGCSLPKIREDLSDILDTEGNFLTKKRCSFSFSSVKDSPLRRIMRLWASTRPPDNTAITLSQRRDDTPTLDQSDQSMQCCLGEQKPRQELFLKISSRDDIILSLEQILHERFKAIQAVEVEMKCLVKAHRIKERKLSEDFIRKEEEQEEVVKSLRKEIGKSDLCLAQREQSLSDSRNYIKELSSELTKVLKVVQSIQAKGDI